jgi:hypothetical protein
MFPLTFLSRRWRQANRTFAKPLALRKPRPESRRKRWQKEILGYGWPAAPANHTPNPILPSYFVKSAGRQKVPFYGVRASVFSQSTRNDSGQRVVNRDKRAEKGGFVQILDGFKPFRAGAGAIWEAWGINGRNRSSGNGGKKAGFGAVFGDFGQ